MTISVCICASWYDAAMRIETGGPDMVRILERRLGLPTAAAYDRVRSAEQKVKDIFPNTEFLLVLGSDDALYLHVYANADSKTAIVELVGDDLR